MPRIIFNNQNRVFFNAINIQVDQYFKERNLKKTGNRHLYIKSGLLITIAIGMYLVLVSVDMLPGIALALCCLFGLTQACIGFNVMHDANHGSFSEKKWLNNIMSLTANMMGASSWVWKQKHNIIHHTYTNIDGVDDDIAKSPFLRMCPSQKHLKLHRYQNIYCVLLYCIMSFWIFVTDFSKYFAGRIHGTPLQHMNFKEHCIFWVSKILYIFFYIIIPISHAGLIPALIGFACMHATLGLTLALVFQLAHVVEATHFREAGQTPLYIPEEWALHQVETTADFATNNKFISWFTGGLNFQVEHHLFPKISHVHYPVIHKIVKDVCANLNIRFNNYPSLWAALRSHFRFMKRLGVQ